MAKRSPLHQIAADTGATFVEDRGWIAPDTYAGTEIELAAVRSGVVLVDESPNGMIQVEGLAEAALSEAYGMSSLGIGEVSDVDGRRVARLRQDVFFVVVQPGDEVKTLKEIRDAAADTFITCTDVTSGRSGIGAIGPRSPELMSKVCGLDFSDGAFPAGQARQTSVAKTSQLIIRADRGGVPAYTLIGSRSLGAYLWALLMEAGTEWDIQPIGRSAHAALG